MPVADVHRLEMPFRVGAPSPKAILPTLDVDILAWLTYPAHPSAASLKRVLGWIENYVIIVDQGEGLRRVDPFDHEGHSTLALPVYSRAEELVLR